MTISDNNFTHNSGSEQSGGIKNIRIDFTAIRELPMRICVLPRHCSFRIITEKTLMHSLTALRKYANPLQ